VADMENATGLRPQGGPPEVEKFFQPVSSRVIRHNFCNKHARITSTVKTSNTSTRLLLEQMAQTPGLYWDPAFIRDPTSIKTLSTCHIKLFSTDNLPRKNCQETFILKSELRCFYTNANSLIQKTDELRE